MRNAIALAVALWAATVSAEQSVRLGRLDVHYAVLASTFLDPGIAERYDIVRARDRGLVTVSALSEEGNPRAASVEGELTNLLGQRSALEFREIVDGPAVYYIASFRYTDGEMLRFAITVETPDAGGGTVRIEQPLYWE